MNSVHPTTTTSSTVRPRRQRQRPTMVLLMALLGMISIQTAHAQVKKASPSSSPPPPTPAPIAAPTPAPISPPTPAPVASTPPPTAPAPTANPTVGPTTPSPTTPSPTTPSPTTPSATVSLVVDPTASPTATPTMAPTKPPSLPATTTTTSPSTTPSLVPTTTRSAAPTIAAVPSSTPSAMPTTTQAPSTDTPTTALPTSSVPSSTPSTNDDGTQATITFSAAPSQLPTAAPTATPSWVPSSTPSATQVESSSPPSVDPFGVDVLTSTTDTQTTVSHTCRRDIGTDFSLGQDQTISYAYWVNSPTTDNQEDVATVLQALAHEGHALLQHAVATVLCANDAPAKDWMQLQVLESSSSSDHVVGPCATTAAGDNDCWEVAGEFQVRVYVQPPPSPGRRRTRQRQLETSTTPETLTERIDTAFETVVELVLPTILEELALSAVVHETVHDDETLDTTDDQTTGTDDENSAFQNPTHLGQTTKKDDEDDGQSVMVIAILISVTVGLCLLGVVLVITTQRRYKRDRECHDGQGRRPWDCRNRRPNQSQTASAMSVDHASSSNSTAPRKNHDRSASKDKLDSSDDPQKEDENPRQMSTSKSSVSERSWGNFSIGSSFFNLTRFGYTETISEQESAADASSVMTPRSDWWADTGMDDLLNSSSRPAEDDSKTDPPAKNNNKNTKTSTAALGACPSTSSSNTSCHDKDRDELDAISILDSLSHDSHLDAAILARRQTHRPNTDSIGTIDTSLILREWAADP